MKLHPGHEHGNALFCEGVDVLFGDVTNCDIP
jgi:hypothetical protein